MNTKHTPGPWRVTRHNSKLIKVESNNRVICDGFSNEVANASLIAASPDLLEALTLTQKLVEELIIRTASIDRMLLEANKMPFECELGEITRIKEQTKRNQAAIAKATQPPFSTTPQNTKPV